MEYKLDKLDNGLNVLYVPLKESNIVCSLLLVNTGSINENKKNHGISHFLEHMCFKGTKKYTQSEILNKELDSLGSSYNAFTSHEYTGYHVTCANSCLNKIIDIMSEMYYNPLFKKGDINKERGVIIEEINMYEDNPVRKILDYMMVLLYKDYNKPGLIDIAGPKKNIKNMLQKDFIDYHNKFYYPGNSLVVVAGNFKIPVLKKLLNNNFNVKTKNKKQDLYKNNLKVKNTNSDKKPNALIVKMKTEQSYLLIGVRAFGVNEKKKIYILELICTVLAKGFSSRLYKRVREEHGLTYFIKSNVDLYSNFGHIQFLMNINYKKIEKAIKITCEEFKKLTLKKITKEELDIAKKQYIGNLSIHLQTAHDYALFYGMNYLLTKEVLTIHQITKIINDINVDDILNVSKEIFKNEKLNMVIIGPYDDNEQKKIAKSLKI